MSDLLGDNSFDQDSPPSQQPQQPLQQPQQFQTVLGNNLTKANVCTECDRLFSRPERLRQHILFKHAGAASSVGVSSTDNHDCGQCTKSFSSKVQLTRHLKVHQDGGNRSKDEASVTTSPTPATTPSSASSAGSTPSKRPHKEQGEKRFQCLQCSKRFPTSKDLKRHDVVHTGNREFQCSFCTHRFGRKDHRMRHEKKTHALELQQQQQKASPPKQPVSPPKLFDNLRSTEIKRQRLRHVSSPSTFRHDVSASPPRAMFQNMLVSSPGQQVKEEIKSEEDILLPKNNVMDGFFEKDSDTDNTGVEKDTLVTSAVEEPMMLIHDSSLGLVRIINESERIETTAANGDLESLLSEIITDSPMALSGSVVDDEDERNDQLSASVPSAFQSPLLRTSQPAKVSLANAPAPSFFNDTTSYSSSYGGAASNFKSPKMMSDLFTRTKNPVLPSIYIDNSLIVPEPTKQKYHNPHTHSLLFEGDLMDVDHFVRNSSAAAAAAATAAALTSGDGKEIINESIFNM